MSSLIKPGLNVIIDGQWGSTGKGKLAGWISRVYDQIGAVVCDFMPNAGHTYIDPDGKVHVFKQLPVAASNNFPDMPVYVGPHSCINPRIFAEEVDREECGYRTFVHPLAVVIEDEDLDWEAGITGRIAATCKGGHGANARKLLRMENVRLARDCPEIRERCNIVDTHGLVQNAIRRGEAVLAETAQGFDLGLNHGHAYPYVTGRDCLLGRAMDNAGVSPRRLGSVIVSLRTHPIRVGNTPDGNSGPFYDDQQELTWDQVSQMAGYNVNPERTTVTQRIRRIFTWSDKQTDRMLKYLEPDFAFLNFVNYFEEGTRDVHVSRIAKKLEEGGCKLALLGTGPRDEDMEHHHGR